MPTAFTTALCPDPLSFFFIGSWQALTLAALMVSVAFTTLLYLLNKVMQNEEGVAWAKIELYETIVTVAIVIGIIALVGAACDLKVSLLFPNSDFADENIFDGAISHLENLADKMQVVIAAVYSHYVVVDIFSSMTQTAWPLGLGTRIQPTAGVGATIKPPLINAMNMMVIGVIITYAQIYLIQFISFGLLKYYLPLGILLRAFAPTRRIGGTIIAVALGFLFIYPFIIIAEGETIYERWTDTFTTKIFSLGSVLDAFNLDDFLTAFGNLFSFKPFAMFEFINALLGSTVGLYVLSLLFFALHFAGFAFLVGLFFPAFNTLLIVTTIRYLARTLGEEIDVTNLTRMI